MFGLASADAWPRPLLDITRRSGSCAAQNSLRTITRTQRSAEKHGRLSTMPVQEQEVSHIWADVIGIPEADIDTNFYDLGGHSLLLMELASRLNRQLGIETDVIMLMEYPTVAKFTSYWNSTEALIDGNR
ncbi:acyl carrier protein [Streptomyces scopuliridis]|uniref:Acyl carrier protein n=1 Tax=Streptomyces scopuliridis TaxID=452529 RepID=A0ACD4ZF33_9ACTN|nr:acyl carrier protein [Streptomyces scopuliridis]WSB31515.1 acyl carrier protein [Streptomyces scopuliridis]WSB95761.1 acyl carrier protein [Streptomyces scopuliridis]WSC10532.1 acyl carrier protein [Streptomyces scopuliridis]